MCLNIYCGIHHTFTVIIHVFKYLLWYSPRFHRYYSCVYYTCILEHQWHEWPLIYRRGSLGAGHPEPIEAHYTCILEHHWHEWPLICRRGHSEQDIPNLLKHIAPFCLVVVGIVFFTFDSFIFYASFNVLLYLIGLCIFELFPRQYLVF